jgi:hypothetical protein
MSDDKKVTPFPNGPLWQEMEKRVFQVLEELAEEGIVDSVMIQWKDGVTGGSHWLNWISPDRATICDLLGMGDLARHRLLMTYEEIKEEEG